MASDTNVINFPGAGFKKDVAVQSPRGRAALELRKQFIARGKGQRNTFVHLGREVHRLVQEVKQARGERSGSLLKAFGENLLKQKRRFAVAQGTDASAICQNPGNWLQVLEGLAEALGRDASHLILDVFEGSDLLPHRREQGHRREQWLAEFHRLIESMEVRLNKETDFLALATYLSDSALIIEDSSLVHVEHPLNEPGLDERAFYAPWILKSMPHVLGLNYRQNSGGHVLDESEAKRFRALSQAWKDEIPEFSQIEVVSAHRTGLVFAVNAQSGRPQLGFCTWHVSEIVFYCGDGKVLRRDPLHQTWESLLEDGYALSEGSFNSVQFSFLGSEQFDRLAATPLVYPDIWADEATPEVWDPAGYIEHGEFPTSSPGRTVAAVVERNLLHAAEEAEKARRLDRLLLAQIQQMNALVEDHRARLQQVVGDAVAALLSEWEHAPLA